MNTTPTQTSVERVRRLTRASHRIGQLIRATHPCGFRTGQWGTIYGLQEVLGDDDQTHLCYAVRWDGARDELPAVDLWRVDDPSDEYEFAVIESTTTHGS